MLTGGLWYEEEKAGYNKLADIVCSRDTIHAQGVTDVVSVDNVSGYYGTSRKVC